MLSWFWSLGSQVTSHKHDGSLPLLSTRPTFIFPAEDCHCRLSSTKWYCLVTEAYVCEQLAHGLYMKVEQMRFKPMTLIASPCPNRYTTMPHIITYYLLLLLLLWLKCFQELPWHCRRRLKAKISTRAATSSASVLTSRLRLQDLLAFDHVKSLENARYASCYITVLFRY